MSRDEEAKIFADEVVEAIARGDYEVASAILEEMIEAILVKKGER